MNMHVVLQNIRNALAKLRDYGMILVLVMAAALLVLISYINITQNNAQQVALDKQAQNTNDLINEVKVLSEQNKKLSQAAANYAYCNAIILAKYTQTNEPITIEDLDKCKITAYPDGNTLRLDVPSGVQGLLQSPAPLSAQQGTTNSRGATATGGGGTSQQTSNTGGTSPGPPIAIQPPTVIVPPQSTTPMPVPTPLVRLQVAPILPGVTLYTPCVGVAKLLVIGCY